MMVSRILQPEVRPFVTKHLPHQRNEGKAQRTELGEGWCIFTADPTDSPSPDLLPITLGQALARWLRTSPAIQVRAILPLVEGGNTTVLHVWYG